MKLTRQLALIDLESTGLDIQKDRILELAILIYDGNAVTCDRVRRFNPGFQIPAESTATQEALRAELDRIYGAESFHEAKQ